MVPKSKIPSVKTLVSTAASAAATVVMIRSIAKDLLPYELQHYLRDKIRFLFSSVSSQISISIAEVDGLHENKLFQASEVYLGAKFSLSARRLKASLPAKETNVVFSMDTNQVVLDVFNGVHFRWTNLTTQKKGKLLDLSFDKKHQEMVLNSYFPYIISEALKLNNQKKTLKIHTLHPERLFREFNSPWVAVNLDHPATFDTLAMDVDTKKMIMEDLEMFVRRKENYRKVGKAWKRGYLLYGPPGTGKSSLIAAMANYLNFDIYDLELTSITRNSDFRNLIIRTANRSILVVEDIDCSVDLERKKKEMAEKSPWLPEKKVHDFQKLSREAKITLSGFLNFIDGLWSSCGDERIIIFTTNHKERLDPALVRPGRMDVHIHMSYCTPSVFKMLASNYLGITDHPLFEEIEQLILAANVTPAEVVEQLMKTEDCDAALKGFLEFLTAKKDVQSEQPREGTN